MLSALAHMHEKWLIHRDVEPENILKTSSGVPKLADFGIAAKRRDVKTCAAGTKFYAAPDVLLSSDNWDGKSDIWSLGVTLGGLALGFTPDTYLKKINRHDNLENFFDETKER